MAFPKVNPKQSFPEMEEKIIAFWKENDTFKKSIENRPEDNPYRFYDGPPFITGTPHYGSLLSSIVKDIVPRYHTMQGKRVERKWGWDCHGLPIEEKVQKKLGLKSNKDIEELGVEKFVEECYKYTRETSAEWDWYIDHIGRWVDMDNAYKTMDQDYMESVMWVFKQMHEKKRVYKGRRVSLYSWKLSTPISNFEVAMDDSYEEVSDPAITVMFPVTGNSDRDTDAEHGGKFEYTQDGALKYVLGVIKDKDGNLLMLKNKKHEGRYQFPGGKIDAGETAEEALKREIQEELGVEVSSMKLLNSKKQYVQATTWEGAYYEVTLSGTPSIQETDKHESLEYFSYEAAENILGYTLKSTNGTVIDEISTLIRTYDTHVLYQIEKGVDTSTIDNYIIAWTTTPWTIPAHMSMALNQNLAYSRVLFEENYYILATARVETVFKGKEFEIAESFMGKDLIGLKYKAPFNFYQGKVDADKNHKILHADFITDTDGTGIGHQAPEFGEVDFQLAQKEGIHISTALDDTGCYTEEISDYEGMHYQEANDVVSEKLKELGLLFKKESINHRVAMCPRSGTKLIYKAQDSWFINIGEMKDRLIAENEGINWQPKHLKHGQFLKSVESAPDWCISRTRYWGTPMPIWMGYDADGEEKDMKVFGSKEEIEAASGMKVTDLHKPYIDSIIWEENGLTYKRLPEVLDVWMDSGSMPYAQMHYPFENKSPMENSYPADFIVEYIGQVRAWFYVMHVVGVALFDKRSFTNVITTGIVMGSDGRKMSKSYGNYPDPRNTIGTYGADAIRFYMANSPLLNGGNMDFKEEGIVEVIKKVILPLWNTYSFFTTYANIDSFTPTGNKTRNNPLDTWIISETNKLVEDVTKGMETYEVTDATRPIVRFMDNLTNWYIRRSRKRFWKSENDGDKLEAYETLYEVLVTVSKVVAPFMPFVTEEIYKNLTGDESVHLTDFPVADRSLIDAQLNADMDLCQKIIKLGLSLRTAQKQRVRQPLASISIGEHLSDYYKDIIKEELNVKKVIEVDSSTIAQKICKPNGRLIGPKFGKDVKNIMSAAKSGNFEEIDENTVKVGEFILEGDDFEIAYVTQGEADNIESGFGMVISMDLELTGELVVEGYARDIVRHVQEARKEAGYEVDDRISVNIIVPELDAILASYDIASETLSTLDTSLTAGDIEKELELGENTAKIILKK